MKWQLRLDVSVKFRAFGMTLANYSDHEHYDLPAELQIVGNLVGNKQIATYSNHGVNASISLVQAEPQTADVQQSGTA